MIMHIVSMCLCKERRQLAALLPDPGLCVASKAVLALFDSVLQDVVALDFRAVVEAHKADTVPPPQSVAGVRLDVVPVRGKVDLLLLRHSTQFACGAFQRERVTPRQGLIAQVA